MMSPRYPDEAPVFTLTSLENTMYSSEAKRQLQQALEVESASMIGDQMVFPLTEWLKDNLPQYVEISKQELRRDETDVTRSAPAPVPETKQVSKDKMTKAQKRRFYSRFGAVDEKPRGWNWVDVISHLSSRPQTLDKSEESHQLQKHFNSFGISFQNFYYIPCTVDSVLIKHDTQCEAITHKEHALIRAVNRLRKIRYHEIIEIEAERLQCHISDVLQLGQVPRLETTQSANFSILNEDLFPKILDKLELIDIVRIGGVCHEWRLMVMSYMQKLQRIDYCLTTHLLRFRGWLRNIRSTELDYVRSCWMNTAMELTLWSTNLTSNLKTLVINWSIPWNDFVVILERCPKLKHLVCEFVDSDFVYNLQKERQDLIQQLDCLILRHRGQSRLSARSMLSFPVHASLSVYSLTQREDDEPLGIREFFRIQERNNSDSPPRQFQALQSFRLKYLRICKMSGAYLLQTEPLCFCLEHCPELLVLIVEDAKLVGSRTLMSIRKGCQKLKALWTHIKYESSVTVGMELRLLHESLSQHNPGAKFNEFHIAVIHQMQIEHLKDSAPFNFICATTNSKAPDRFSVQSAFIRNIIGSPL
eukprot:g6101.t1